jgi:hypothetical protein
MRTNRPLTLSVSTFLTFCLLGVPTVAHPEDVDPAAAKCPTAPSNGAAPVCVTTYHNQNTRLGLNSDEPVLNKTKVKSGLKSFTDPAAGQVYAQPLFLPQVKMLDGKLHNVAFIVTETNDVYAWDGDVAQTKPYWHVNLLTPPLQPTRFQLSAGMSGPPTNDIACGNIAPNVGITSTPVITITSSTSSQINGATIFVVSRSKSTNTVPAPTYYQTLYALDATSGKVIAWIDITDTNNGVSFDPLRQNQRASLLYQGGQVYIAWAAHCDNGSSDPRTASWYGWLMSYTLRNGSFGSGPTASWLASSFPEAGIWQSGAGPAGDGTNLYFATGNGSTTEAPYMDESPCVGCYGDSIIKLSGTPVGGTFNVLDSFTPYDHPFRFCDDYDVGAGGLMLLATSFNPPNLIVQSGKEGNIYLLNAATGSMGGYGGMTGSFLCPITSSSGSDHIVQAKYGDLCTPMTNNPECGILGSPVFWNNNVFFGARCQPIKQYSLTQTNWLTLAAVTTVGGNVNANCKGSSGPVFSFPGPGLGVSEYKGGAVLWALDSNGFCGSNRPHPPVLYAYDATNLAGPYLFRGNAGTSTCGVKFTVPTVVNGHVYVGTGSQLVVFH